MSQSGRRRVETSRRSFLGALGSGLAVAGGACAARRGAGAASGPQRQPTSSVSSVEVLRLGANENPYGPAPSALRAIGDALPESNRYAFSAMSDTAAALAEHLHVPASHVVLGCGSSEILEAAVSAFTSRDKALVTAAPTFELPAARAASLGAGVTDVRVDERGRLDLAGMLDRAPGSGLVYVCNPNNPTSTVHASKDIQAFIDDVHRRSPGTVVLVDEAYHEYVEAAGYASAAPLTVTDPGLVVTRTFSKIYGLAGLRVGCAVSQPATLARLRPWLGDMTMSVLTAAAAGASLADAAHVERQRSLNHEARAFTLDALARAGCTAYDSDANFVMVDVARDCRSFAAACAARGIRIARPFPPLEHHARITIGTLDEMRRATAVFAEVLATPPAVTARWPGAVWSEDGRGC
jgi:histidinol-phosphate aminotransferase